MSKSTISTFQLFELFPDEESARVYLEGRLWPNGTICPTCKAGDRITPRKAGYYRCNACALDFTVRTGTVLDRSHIPLQTWLALFVLIAQSPDITSESLAIQLSLTQKSAWLAAQRIYEAAGPLLANHLEMDGTLYRLIDGWPGYRVGADGSIWTCRRKGNTGSLGFVWRELNPTTVAHGKNPDGRRVVTLRDRKRKKWAYVHDLACAAFHGPCPPGKECRHLDGDSTNDAASNLKWGTSQENRADTAVHGRLPRGEQNGKCKLSDAQVTEILGLKGVRKRGMVAADFQISPTYVSYLWSGRFRTVDAVAGKRLTYKRLIR